MPERIQRKRTKGWRMPPNTVYVGRPSKWGNPWHVRDMGRHGPLVQDQVRNSYPSTMPIARRFAVWKFRRFLSTEFGRKRFPVEQLRGKNLACWCRIGEPCHADVLLELANQPVKDE